MKFVISVWCLFCNAVLSDLSSFEIISLRKNEFRFTFIVFCCRGCQCYVSLPHGSLSWSMNVAFHGHTCLPLF